MSMNQSDALEAIQGILSGKEWDSDTVDEVAIVMREAGYEILSPDDVDADEVPFIEGD